MNDRVVRVGSSPTPHVHANLRDRVAQLLAHRLDRPVLNGQAQAGGQYGGRR